MYDPIMQVGRTPQITQDVALNPLSIYMDDITSQIFATLTLGAGQEITSGTVLNLSNPNYDYTVAPAINIRSNAYSGTSTSILQLDMGKYINFRGATFYFNISGDTTYAGTVEIQYSTDAVNWITLSTDTEPAGGTLSVDYTRTFSGVQARYFRLNITLASGVGVGKVCGIYAIKLQIDSNQKYYTF